MESPDAFLAKHAQEKGSTQERWEAEFRRGVWFVDEIDKKPCYMVGVTHESGMPSGERYLEYVWVAPEHRRSRMAYGVLTDVLDDLTESGMRAVLLWVLDGNEKALGLYKRLNFQSTPYQQTLPEDPGRMWVQLRLDLSERSVRLPEGQSLASADAILPGGRPSTCPAA